MTAPEPGLTPMHLKVAEAFVRAREAMRPHDRAHADARLTSWLDGFEADLAKVAEPVLRQYVDHPDVPDEIRTALNDALAPAHATAITALGVIVAAIFYPLASAAMTGPAQGIQQESLRKFANTQLSPAELALGVIKNTLPPEINPFEEALKSGVEGGRMDVLIANTGEPPGPQELTSLLNRGILDEATWEHGIRQGRLRDEWIPYLSRGRLAPAPPAEIVNGVIKQRLDPNRGALLFEQSGGDTANWDWIIAAAGRPYGIEQALELWNREDAVPGTGINELQVDAVIAHSDVNPEFTDQIKKLRYYVPPVRSILPMLRAGAITEPEARTLFAENGVRPADADKYLAEAAHGRTTTVRTLTEAQVVRMYSAQLIDRPTAQARLEGLRIVPADAALLLDYADNVRHERYLEAVLSRVHSRYVAWKMTDAEAAAAMGQDGIPGNAQQDYLRLWRIERDSNVHVLTSAAIVGAYRRRQIGAAETKARLLAIGVQQHDLAIVVADGFPPGAFVAAQIAATRILIEAVVNA